MSERYVKVDTVETVDSTNSTALIVFVVSLLAIAVIALAFWQPWATQTPQSNSTTIIREGQAQQPQQPNSTPIIVNPPASNPGDTKIDIHNEIPKQDPPKTDTNAGGATNNDVDVNNTPTGN